MIKRVLSIAEARATLSDAIREVEGGSTLLITRHGRPVAALVRAEDADALERLRASGPEGGLASVAGGWRGSEDLVTAIATASPRSHTRRPVQR